LTESYIYFCLNCGKYVEPDGYPPVDCLCKKCHNAYWVKWRKEYYAKKRANGWVPESRRKAGKKAYSTRLIRMAHMNPQEYNKRMSKMDEKDPRRARYIRGRAKKESINTIGYHDNDVGKVIF